MTAPTPVEPLINDRYWFNFSKTLIDDSIARRDASSEALQKLVLWLWATYTGAAAVGFALSGKQLSYGTALAIAIPSALLIIVYWCTVWAQMPQVVKFDPRSPTEIEAAHASIIKGKSRRIAITLFASVVAAFAVAVGLVVASVAAPPRFVAPAFLTNAIPVEGRLLVSVTAYVGTASRAQLRIAPAGVPAGVKAETTFASVVPTAEGLVQTSTVVNVPGDSVRVSLVWKSDASTDLELRRTLAVSRAGAAKAP